MINIDWGEFWSIVSSLSSAISALAAAYAVRLVVRQNRETEQIRRLQKWEQYYDSWVSAPINEGVRVFRAKVLDLARSFSHDVDPYRLINAQQLLITREGGRLVEDINAEYYQLKSLVLGGAEAWENEELRNQFRDALENLQDETIQAAEVLVSSPGYNLSQVLERNCALILRLVRQGDPGARNPDLVAHDNKTRYPLPPRR